MPNPFTDKFSDDPSYFPPDADPADPKKVELALFPGEYLDEDTNTWRGKIYARVSGELVRGYEACSGPAPGSEHQGRGGHYAGATTAGNYTLAARERHVTPNWPRSVVPWGAVLRVRADQEIEYSPDGGKSWRKATGPDGEVTRAEIRFEELTRADDAKALAAANKTKVVPPPPFTAEEKERINQSCRQLFYDLDGKLLAEYNKNDFGKWAWCLVDSKGQRTAYFLHTTPSNEVATAAGRDFQLTQSHGCIHVRPLERDDMERRGFLQRGVRFVVKPYRVKGP